MGVKQDLQNAAALLRDGGWCQFDMSDGYGRHCVHGALLVVAGRDNGRFYAARDFLRDRVTGGGLMSWNDSPGRTAEEVIAALEAAAEAADA